jgi:hypothetical protein
MPAAEASASYFRTGKEGVLFWERDGPTLKKLARSLAGSITLLWRDASIGHGGALSEKKQRRMFQ